MDIEEPQDHSETERVDLSAADTGPASDGRSVSQAAPSNDRAKARVPIGRPAGHISKRAQPWRPSPASKPQTESTGTPNVEAVATVAAFVLAVLVGLLTEWFIAPLAVFSWLLAVIILRRRRVERRIWAAFVISALVSAVAVVSTATSGPVDQTRKQADTAVSSTTSTSSGPSVDVVPSNRQRDRSGLETALGVANVTRGDDTYSRSIRASYDDVIKVQLWYGNYSADSRVFENFVASIIVPSTEPGAAKVSGIASFGDTELHPVARIKLARPDARLSYIPGSLVWRHNIAAPGDEPRYENEVVPDTRLIGDLTPLENLHSGEDYEANLTILLRVQVSSVGIRVVGSTGGSNALQEVDSNVGDVVHLAVEVENLGNTALSGIEVWGLVPPDLELVPGSATLQQGSSEPMAVADGTVAAALYAPVSSTVRVGNLPVGGRALLSLQLRVLGPGGTTRSARAVVRAVPVGTYNNFATIDVAATQT